MRQKRIVLAAGLSAFIIWAGCAAEEQRSPEGDGARVYSSNGAEALTPVSRATAFAVVADFLADRGALTEDTLRVVSERVADTGITHVRMEQKVEGLRVAGSYVKAALNERGQLVHLIDHVVASDASSVAPAAIDERQALAVAMREHGLAGAPTLAARADNKSTFTAGPVFYSDPTVERVAFADADGQLATGFLVETWTLRGNVLLHTLIDGRDGSVVSVEPLTAYDRYNVFAIDPGKGAQTIVSGPGAGNAQSTQGWLSGAQTTNNIHGNNVMAYLDRDANNAADAGGTAVTNGDFLTVADLGAAPTATGNRAAAVQNLFFLTNSEHDILYQAGFNEAAGNFQVNNFGRGGAQNDPVRAEAEDGSGTNNANFSTPADGASGRMQMFLFDAPAGGGGGGDTQVVVTSPTPATFPAAAAAFGPALSATGISGLVTLVNDGTAPTSDGCTAIQTSLTGRIALIDRGTCTFVVKVQNAQNAGAVAVIVANNVDDTFIQMGGTSAAIRIPSVMVGRSSGVALRAANVSATARRPPAAVMLDGDLDSDVVYHEGCHGLSQRMIGGMSGRLAGAIGEGMSDVCSVIINNDDVVGEYVVGDPAGIRTAPYHDYPRTYGDIAGTEVHFDGEVYGAIGWLMNEIFQREGLSRDLLLTYIVDGMNFTPATPRFESMRDGILQAVANRGLGHECLIWEAFAHYGVGVGATGAVVGTGVRITESFTVPAQCQ